MSERDSRRLWAGGLAATATPNVEAMGIEQPLMGRATPPAFFQGTAPRVLGHRGYCGRYLENTLAAFDAALAEGAEGVEFDARLTRDGIPMVLHDCDLKRTTRGRYGSRLVDLTASDVERLDLADDERIPRLNAVLRWAERHDALLNIELKSEQAGDLLVSRVTDALRASRLGPSRVVLSSFEFNLVQGLVNSLSEYPIAFLFEKEVPALDTWIELVESGRGLGGRRLVHPDLELVTPERALAWRQRGLGVGLWGIDTAEQVRRARAINADLVIVDQPRLVR